MPGYIKLYRKLLDNPIFQNEKLLKMFIWCLLKASYSEHEQLVGLQKVILQPGQFVYGRLKASEELKIKPSTCNDIITWLKREQIIDIKTNNKFSLVTIVNWELYQVDEEETDIKTDSNPTTKQQQSNTNKKGKEREERKEGNIYSSDSVVIYLSQLLFTLMQQNNPTAKRPNIQKWAYHIDLMIRIDNRSPEDIEKIIRFSQQDLFWKTNILSTIKLREQYDKLYLKSRTWKPSGSMDILKQMYAEVSDE